MSALITNDAKSAIQAAGIAEIIQDKMGLERFTAAALQIWQNPAVMACTQDSVLGALLKAALLDFQINPEFGHCWIVPRVVKMKDAQGKDAKNSDGTNATQRVASFQIGYKGWQELAFRGGTVESFNSYEVREFDRFEMQHGTSPSLIHVPGKVQSERGKVIMYVVEAQLNSSRVIFETITAEDAEAYRRFSEQQFAYDTNTRKREFSPRPVGVWATNYTAMACRLPIKTICTRRIKTTVEIQNGILSDGAAISVTNGQVVELPPMQVFEAEETVQGLHEDYIAEIEAAKTLEALLALYKNREESMAERPIEFNLYKSACAAKKEKMGWRK